MAAHASAARTAFLLRVREALPEGRTLPDRVWRRRHRALLTLLWLHAVGLAFFALGQGYGVVHALQEGGIVALIAGAATAAGTRKRAAATLVSLGLITSSAVLVHLWGGVIEAHFHFFVMIVLLSLYEDWVPFLVAAAYVVLHHGLAGTIDPNSVYNHADAVAASVAVGRDPRPVRDGRRHRVGRRVAPERGRPRRDASRPTGRRATARSASRARSRTRRSGWRSRASSPARSGASCRSTARCPS